MSKKNRNKRKFDSDKDIVSSPAKNAAGETIAERPSEEKLQDEMKQEFKKLAIIVVFILALLAGLYIFDKQTHIVQTFTHKLFSLF